MEMLDALGDWKRTHNLGQLRGTDVGQEVVLMGWVQTYRDHGGVIFIDLRDKHGISQVVFDPKVDQQIHDRADAIRTEWVIAVQGKVVHRPEGMVNPNMPTGEIDVVASELKILNISETVPFLIEDGVNVREEVRLRYRYLDLRRPEVQKRLIDRARGVKWIRDYLGEAQFVDVETPFLTKSTPEGARDYLVPSRLYPGRFFALPQSPQIFKQLLMVSGFERYYQVVRCMRDEDPRADRQPEFTQIDMELSFVSQDDIIELIEGLLAGLWKVLKGVEIPTPFPKLTYKEAIARFGIDRPDTRFGLELYELSEVLKGTDYKFFEQALDKGGIIKGINAKDCAKLSRKDTDTLTHALQAYGATGLTVLRIREDAWQGPAAKYIPEKHRAELIKLMDVEVGDMLMILGDKPQVVNDSLAHLRLMLAEKLELIDPERLDFLWVMDFPLFEWHEDDQRFYSMHHPFTSPRDEDIPLLDTDPAAARANAYDVVLNGTELGGGSIRNHQAPVQAKLFELLGIGEEEARAKFGFLLDALSYGAPPHGGLALGLDRIMQLLLGGTSIRDVIAFPKTQNAACLMTDAPSEVSEDQLGELYLKLDIDR